MSHLKRDALAYLRHCRVPGSSAPRAKFWWFADCIQYDNQLSFKKKAPPILFERNSRRADSFISKNEGMNEGATRVVASDKLVNPARRERQQLGNLVEIVTLGQQPQRVEVALGDRIARPLGAALKLPRAQMRFDRRHDPP